MDPSILINWTSPFSILGVSCVLFSFLFYFFYIFLLANSEDPDQTPRSAASDLGLYCLPRSQKRDARLILFNIFHGLYMYLESKLVLCHLHVSLFCDGRLKWVTIIVSSFKHLGNFLWGITVVLLLTSFFRTHLNSWQSSRTLRLMCHLFHTLIRSRT